MSGKLEAMSDTVQIEDALSVEAQKRQPLYAGRVQVYPKRVSGFFRRLKWAGLIVLLAIYYTLPWIRWDRGPNAPDQAVLADIAHERLYVFFIEIWPQELYYLVGLLILGAVGLFLATSLAGRVWCGYACPQTVWTDLYMWVERLIEGDRNARIRLDRAPFGPGKAARKIFKHAVWLIIAASTGGAWIMYFNDAPRVVGDIFTGQASMTVYGFTALFTGTTYLLAGWAREQVCTYMCPWPRFQSAMFDEDSLIVTYERWRGEPRGRHRKGESWEGRGDCVDCNLCVAVCPTGIDIRDGNQLECISCALCVDACNSVMARVGRPLGLITYDTERNQQCRATGRPLIYRLVRPRTLLYGLLLLVVAGAMLWSLMFRPTLDINVLQERNPLFVTLSDGDIRNGYTIKLLNKTLEARTFSLRLEGPPEAVMQVVGQPGDAHKRVLLAARPDSVATFRVYITLPQDALRGDSTPLAFVLSDDLRGEVAVHETAFRGPSR
jgi:cytochrome c oxidase accessory protein FixG